MAEKKRDDEAEILQGVRDLHDFAFAVPEKIDKRCCLKWKDLCEFEADFDKIYAAWKEHRFYVNTKFKFPSERIHLNLDAVRTFANGVGHLITHDKYQ